MRFDKNSIIQFSEKIFTENNIKNWKVLISDDLKPNNAGLCIYETKTLVFNDYLLQYSNDYIIDIIYHEIAHILTPNDKSHGKQWEKKFIDLGGSGNSDIDFFKASKYSIYCTRCDKGIISSDKKNSLIKKYIKGEIKLYCKNCKCYTKNKLITD